jgi:hypothetical protein
LSLTFDSLDQILTEVSFHIESEDDLFLRIVRLGSEYGPLLRHIEIGFIEDTKGKIFGGFTPLEWESRKWNEKTGKENNLPKADPSLKSFLCTLKNPHNVPARRLSLKAEEKDWAIICRSERGPRFYDSRVSDNCNANADSETWLGYSYTNDTGLNRKTFFTGSPCCQVKEIEVFEITHETDLQPNPVFGN